MHILKKHQTIEVRVLGESLWDINNYSRLKMLRIDFVKRV